MAIRIKLPKRVCGLPQLALDGSGQQLLIADEGIAKLFDARSGRELSDYPWLEADGDEFELLVDGREQDLEELDPSEMFGVPRHLAFSDCGRYFVVVCVHFGGSSGYNDTYLFDRENVGRPLRYLDVNRWAGEATSLFSYNDPEAALFTDREVVLLGEFGLLCFPLDGGEPRHIVLPRVDSKIGLSFTSGKGASLAMHAGLLAVGFCDSVFIVRLSDGAVLSQLRSPGDVGLGNRVAFASAEELVIADLDAKPAQVWRASDGSSALTEDREQRLHRVDLRTGRRTRVAAWAGRSEAADGGKRRSKLLHISADGRSVLRTDGGVSLGDDTRSVVITQLVRKPA
jgi:hypothetical protein